eukprot:1305455-Amphidinium_carterae.1
MRLALGEEGAQQSCSCLGFAAFVYRELRNSGARLGEENLMHHGVSAAREDGEILSGSSLLDNCFSQAFHEQVSYIPWHESLNAPRDSRKAFRFRTRSHLGSSSHPAL